MLFIRDSVFSLFAGWLLALDVVVAIIPAVALLRGIY